MKHVHRNFFGASWQRGTEKTLLNVGVGTRIDDFLYLRHEFRIQHSICFVEYQVLDAELQISNPQ